MKSELQQSCYDESSSFEGAQQQQQQTPPQIPDHLKCGEVYTWLCAAELYAVECKLCEDHPLCPLSEFSQHMEIWHTEWQPTFTRTHEKEFINFVADEREAKNHCFKEYDLDDSLSSDRDLSFTTEDDSGLFKTSDQLRSCARSVESHEELLEPFEQVLIEQDLATNTTIQISEEEEEYFRAQSRQFAIEIKPQQRQTFVTRNLTLANKEPSEESTTVKESELEHLTVARRGNGKSGLQPAENFVNKTIQNHDITESETAAETSDNETNCSDSIKPKKCLRKFKLETKGLPQKYSKLKEIKRVLIEIIKDINDFRETDDAESETSESKNYKRKLQSKFLLQQQNFISFSDSAENETDLLEQRYDFNIKKQVKTHFKKFKKTTKPKRSLKIINKNKSKQKNFNSATVLETIESERQSKCSENITAYQEDEVKSTIINETPKRNVKAIENSETKLNEMNFVKEQKYVTVNLEEPNGNETGIYANEMHLREDEKEINKNVDNRSEMECLGKSRKRTEYFLNRNVQTESKIFSTENIEDKNKSEILVHHNNKTKSNENVIATDNSKLLCHNIRKSLRNTRKNPKYLENSLQIDEKQCKVKETNGIKTHNFKEEVNGLKNFSNARDKDIRPGIDVQRLNDPKNLIRVKTAMEPNAALITSTQDHKAQISPRQLSVESKGILRNGSRQLSKNKQVKNELKGRFRNSKNLLFCKQKLYFRARNLKRRNPRSNKKKAGQQVLRNSIRSRKGYRRKNISQSALQRSLSNSVVLYENRDYPESKEISALNVITQNEQKEKNSFINEIAVCKEIDLSANKCDHENVWEQRKRIKVGQSNDTDAEEYIKSIATEVYEENIISAGDCDEVNHSDQRDIKVIYGENNSQSKEFGDLNFSDSAAICETNSIQAKETDVEGCIKNTITRVYRENINTAKERDEINLCEQKALKAVCQAENIYEKRLSFSKEIQTENVTEITGSKEHEKDGSPEGTATTESIIDKLNSCSNTSNLNSFTQQHIAAAEMPEPISPLSPRTEEEHFEFYEPKEKLNKEHITHLIKLYREHPRLWDQSHPDFCEPPKCRISWQQITDEWNEYCKRKFTIAEVRIRICTLCQRFVQEKDRFALEGELDECAKFPYYEQMKFLEHQKSLRKRRELYEQQNEKILEIYQYFPILWHVRHYKSRQAKRRAEAFESISKVLKLFSLHLSSLGVQKRIRSLRKCYRLEKIRHLHAKVEQTPFKAEFRHYERMQFLDKHIDPFVCRICGKIFENLQGFREHLEAENHGSILQQDIDNENILDQNEAEEISRETGEFSSACSQMECFTESENSTDILQRFIPFSTTPNAVIENNFSEGLECFPLNTPNEPLINSWQYEDQLIEEIIENDRFSQHGLDQFINSVTSCEELTNGNSLFEEVLSPSLLHTDNSYIVEHPDIISDPSRSLLSPLTDPESLISVDFGTENSLTVEHPNLIAHHNFSVPQPAETTITVPAQTIEQKQDDLQANVNMTGLIAELENQVTAQVMAQKPSSSTNLLVKVQCADYSVNIKLNTEPLSTLNPNLLDSDNELSSSGDNSIAPFPDLLIHKMIEIYRKYPQLWDPNHLDFNSRILRRQAWVNLTTEFNASVCKQLSWRTLHRKLTDYAKYYKKLVTEQGDYDNLVNKWAFYEDFKFLDDVIAVNTELQRSVHHRDNNFKIISTYKSFPQLWNIKHPDFSKRSCKQRNIELMCNRLQEENNLQLTTERLKNRLIELRAQYRLAKKQRLKCLKSQLPFTASEFEFYEALNFLDDHIDPFVCDKCQMEFKKLTDYNHHLKKEHSPKKRIVLPPAEPGLENVCHICGIKFTTRSNLMHHIKRHEGIRNYACTMCPKKFYASHALKVHIRSHTKECPYTCEKCGMSFVSASKLNQHVKRHLNQKDFECSYCPKTFFTAFEKDRHERRHLNIRDKVCPICGKTFVAGSSYYAHLMLHNDTKRFECDKCDMKFAQYPGLFKHKKRHHT